MGNTRDPGEVASERMGIEPLSVRHIDEVLEIEAACFRKPWTRLMFLPELDKSFGRNFAAVTAGRVAGFMIGFSLPDGGHLVNIAVRPELRRNGIGRLLLGYFIEKLKSEGKEMLFLEARRSNEAAISLYRSFGLDRIGVRYAYYDDNGEDAIVMAGRLK
jgi:ribosomal-protein-alanine N-acetyltransferase